MLGSIKKCTEEIIWSDVVTSKDKVTVMLADDFGRIKYSSRNIYA